MYDEVIGRNAWKPTWIARTHDEEQVALGELLERLIAEPALLHRPLPVPPSWDTVGPALWPFTRGTGRARLSVTRLASL